MAADYANTLSLVLRAISLGTPVADAWDAVVDHISRDLATDVSLNSQALNLSQDVQRLQAWLLEIFQTFPPPRAIRGLRFGLFHPSMDGCPSCDLYLTGSRMFDEDTDAWAVDHSFQATSNPRSQVLDALYLISAKHLADRKDAVVHMCLWYALLAVAELCRRHSAVIRGSAPRRGIGVGFDSGDLINIGVHSKLGFTPPPFETGKRRRKKRRLLPADYFELEGGPQLLMSNCIDNSLPKDLFRVVGSIDLRSLYATIHPDWPNQQGTLGLLYPFHCYFVSASFAQQIEAAFPNEVQFHTLKIAGRTEDWRLMKIMHCVNCYDRDESRRQYRLTLSRKAAAGRNIFFVAGYYEGLAVIVSRPVAQLFIDQEVVGAEFVPIATI